jgi:lipoyl(octanoyl) transferase
VIIHFCKQTLGLHAYRIPDYTGVWIEDRKIAAIGIKVSRWITMHGLALNVTPKMNYFRNIIPCGIKEKEVASLEQFVPGIRINGDLQRELFKSFEEVFQVELRKPVGNENLLPVLDGDKEEDSND